MNEPTVFDDPTYQEMNGSFDPTGYEDDIYTYVPCTCTGINFCHSCLPF